MSTRAQALAEQLDQVNSEATAAVEACDDAAWRAGCPEEGWPAAFTAWHIGDGHATIMGLVATVANGQSPPALAAAMLDARNAANLDRHATCSRQDALDLLRQNGSAAAAAIRGLSDEQLDRTAVLELFGGTPLSVQQLVEGVLIGHARHHLASLQAGIQAAV